MAKRKNMKADKPEFGGCVIFDGNIQQIAEALGMTVDITDPGLQDLAPLKRLTP